MPKVWVLLKVSEVCQQNKVYRVPLRGKNYEKAYGSRPKSKLRY